MSKKNNPFENKTTSELLDLLSDLPDEGDEWTSGGKYDQLMGELETRYPFQNLLDKEWEDSLPQVLKTIKELQEEIKKLKRHKHDEKTGDVMVRV